MSFDDPFEAPDGPPQLEAESLGLRSIRNIMEDPNLPIFDENLAAELIHFCRQSVAVRAAIRFSLIKARQAEVDLRTASTMDEVRTLQGKITGAIEYNESLIIAMEEAQTRALPDGDEDVEDEE